MVKARNLKPGNDDGEHQKEANEDLLPVELKNVYVKVKNFFLSRIIKFWKKVTTFSRGKKKHNFHFSSLTFQWKTRKTVKKPIEKTHIFFHIQFFMQWKEAFICSITFSQFLIISSHLHASLRYTCLRTTRKSRRNVRAPNAEQEISFLTRPWYFRCRLSFSTRFKWDWRWWMCWIPQMAVVPNRLDMSLWVAAPMDEAYCTGIRWSHLSASR